jgi:hypothetical protein
MLSTDAALPVSTSLTRIVPAAGPGLSVNGLALADTAISPETLDFAQLLGLGMSDAAAPADALAQAAANAGLALTPAPQRPGAGESDAAMLPVDGKPGKSAGKTLPVTLPTLPAIAATALAAPVAPLDAEAPITLDASPPALSDDDITSEGKAKDAAMPDALPLIQPAALPVMGPLPVPPEAAVTPGVDGDAAPRAAPVVPDGSASNRPKAAPVAIDLAADTRLTQDATPAAPAPASPAPAMAQALASLRLMAGGKAPAHQPSLAHDRGAPVAAASALLQPTAAPMPVAAPQSATPEATSPAPVRVSTRLAKAAPGTAQPAASAAAATDPSAGRDPLAAPVPPVLAADLVMPLAAPAQPAPAQAVISAPQTAAPTSTDFAGLIDRLVEARDAAGLQSGGATTIAATLAHTEFGRVSMQFRQDDGALSVSMASSDPGFAPAVQMATTAPGTAANEDRGNAARQDQQQAGTPGNQNAGQNATGSQAQTQTQSQSQSQPSSPRGNGQSRADEDQQSSTADPRQTDGSIYA